METQMTDHNADATIPSFADSTLDADAKIEHTDEPPSPHSLEDLLKLSQATATHLERLAASIDSTNKPYAHRKAATLRREQTKLDTLIGKLMDPQQAGGEEGMEGPWTQGGVKSDGAPDYNAIAEQLYEHSQAIAEEQAIEDGAEMTAPKASTEMPEYHTPPPSDHEKGTGDVPDAPKAQRTAEVANEARHAVDTNTSTKLLALAAQDLAVVSRLVIAKQMLEVKEPDTASVVEAFALQYCGTAAWSGRVAHYDGYEPVPKGSVEWARAHLEDAAAMLAAFDAKVGDELRAISGS